MFRLTIILCSLSLSSCTDERRNHYEGIDASEEINAIDIEVKGKKVEIAYEEIEKLALESGMEFYSDGTSRLVEESSNSKSVFYLGSPLSSQDSEKLDFAFDLAKTENDKNWDKALEITSDLRKKYPDSELESVFLIEDWIFFKKTKSLPER